jgi:hypothetical protein
MSNFSDASNLGNIALNKPTSSNFSVAPYLPYKVVTGNTSVQNRWVGSVPGWVKIDLGFPYWIDRWTLKNMGVNQIWSSNYNMIDYILQGSNIGTDNDSDWTSIYSVFNNSSNITSYSFTPCRYRYYRVYIKKGIICNTKVAAFSQLELYEYANPPYLSDLTISTGALSPAFNMKVFDYTVTASIATEAITVTPTTTTINGIITVNGETVPNGKQSQPIALSGSGTTTIKIVVSVEGGPVRETYTINVSKETISPYLKGLVVNGASRLNPSFKPTTTSYNTTVANGTSSVTVTPTAESAGATVLVNGEAVMSGQTSQPIDLHVGQNQILVYVEKASPQFTYAINVNRPS